MRLRLPDRAIWSASFQWSEGEKDAETVVLVAPGAGLRRGFELARIEVARGGRKVRLIGRGITLRDWWPEWVPSATRLCLTELDAYLPNDRTTMTNAMSRDLRTWLADIFRGALDGVEPEQALWAAANVRVFQAAFRAWPLVVGLTHHHGKDSVLCVGSEWAGTSALEDAVVRAGGSFNAVDRAKPVRAFALRAAAWGTASAAAAIAVRAREYWSERPSREKLRALREDRKGAPEPRVWIGLLGDWPRVVRHVTEGVGDAARERDQPVGVLLQSSLRPGSRDHAGANPQTVVFPSLDHPALAGRVSWVDQCVSAESAGQLAQNAATSLVRSGRVMARILRRGRFVALGEVRIDLAQKLQGLARLATFDVLRGNEAASATRRLLERASFSGAKVVWPHASLTVEAVPDLLIQQRGATTYDFVHGSLYYDTIDLMTFDRTFSTVQLTWTEAEARQYAPLTAPQRNLGGYMPRTRAATRRLPRGRRPGEPVRLLALTNYLCGSPGAEEPLPLECYLHAFFDAIAVAKQGAERPVEVVWRPHPSDNRPRVEAAQRAHSSLDLTLSLEPDGLDRHLSWADVVVSTISSVVIEALDHPVPIFIHEPPVVDAGGVISLFSVRRRFRQGEELRAKLVAYLEDSERDSSEARRYEVDLERDCFGDSRTPKQFGPLLWP